MAVSSYWHKKSKQSDRTFNLSLFRLENFPSALFQALDAHIAELHRRAVTGESEVPFRAGATLEFRNGSHGFFNLAEISIKDGYPVEFHMDG